MSVVEQVGDIDEKSTQQTINTETNDKVTFYLYQWLSTINHITPKHHPNITNALSQLFPTLSKTDIDNFTNNSNLTKIYELIEDSRTSQSSQQASKSNPHDIVSNSSNSSDGNDGNNNHKCQSVCHKDCLIISTENENFDFEQGWHCPICTNESYTVLKTSRQSYVSFVVCSFFFVIL